MVSPLTVVKCAGLMIAVALPVTLPAAIEGCAKCMRAGEKVTKELGLALLNIVSCGTVQIVRNLKKSGTMGAPGDAKASGAAE